MNATIDSQRRSPRYAIPKWWEFDHRIVAWLRYRRSWEPISGAIKQYMLEVHKITGSELRDMRIIMNRDAVQVRTWNHRRYEVNGMQMMKFVFKDHIQPDGSIHIQMEL